MNSVSPTSDRFPSFQHWSPIGAVASGIFVIDFFTPLGVAAGVLYIAAVLMSLRHQNSQLSLGTAVICSILTIIALFASPIGGEYWKVLLNRSLALFAIWTTTVLGRIQLQQAGTIQKQDRTMQDLLKMLPSACFTFDRQGTILSWNPAAESIYGYTEQEAVGASSYDLIVTPETVEQTQDVIDKIFEGEPAVNQIWHDQNKQREKGWRAGSLFPTFDKEGKVLYGININVDITAQKKAEFDLQTKNALLQAILDSATDSIYAKDQEGNYLLFNKAAAYIVGQPSEKIIGMSDIQIFGQETATKLRESDELIYSTNQTITAEETVTALGETTAFSTIKSPLNDPHGKRIGLVGISRDITQDKKVQHDLLLTERVFLASPDHISILGNDYRYHRVNPSYEKVHGKPSQSVIGMSVPELLGEEVFTQTIKSKLDRCLQGEDIHYEAWFRFADNQGLNKPW